MVEAICEVSEPPLPPAKVELSRRFWNSIGYVDWALSVVYMPLIAMTSIRDCHPGFSEISKFLIIGVLVLGGLCAALSIFCPERCFHVPYAIYWVLANLSILYICGFSFFTYWESENCALMIAYGGIICLRLLSSCIVLLFLLFKPYPTLDTTKEKNSSADQSLRGKRWLQAVSDEGKMSVVENNWDLEPDERHLLPGSPESHAGSGVKDDKPNPLFNVKWK